MNREIKFEIMLKALDDTRSGHKKGDEVRMVNEIFDRKNGVAFWEIGLDWEIVYQRQYTGYKDKNGVEIYEGDILQGTYSGITFTSVVLFFAGCFRVTEADYNNIDEYAMTIDDAKINDDIVIGNIYENPKLHNNSELL